MEMATPTLLDIVFKAECCVVSIPSFFLAFVIFFLFPDFSPSFPLDASFCVIESH